MAVLHSSPAHAQSSSSVDPTDPIYRSIDRFIADGLVDTAIVGQRPYSRREVARIVAQAVRNRTRLERVFADTALGTRRRAALARRLQYTNALIDEARRVYLADTARTARPTSAPKVLVAAWLDRMSSDATVLGSEPRVVPNGNIGDIDAVTNPLVDDRQGRWYANGATGAAEGVGHADFGRRVSLGAAVEGRVLRQREGRSSALGRVNVLSASTILRNVRIDAGRDYLSWGQTPRGGLALSANAPALDMVRLASDAPFVLPWLFRYAGPIGASLFVADLGTDREFPHAKLVGWKVSAAPWRRLELGFTVLDQMGGHGAPPASFGDRVLDVVPFIDAMFRTRSDSQFSNKLAGLDMRLRVPGAAGLELYGEALFDDFDPRRFQRSVWEDAGLIGGFALPRLLPSGAFRFDGEVHHTGLRYYQHEQFVSGITYHQRILGDALGPRADAGYLTLTWTPSVGHEIGVRGAIERRSNDQYELLARSADDADFRFQRVEALPRELRRRLTVQWSSGSGISGLRTIGEAGVERVSHFDFANVGNKSNLLLRLTVEYRP